MRGSDSVGGAATPQRPGVLQRTDSMALRDAAVIETQVNGTGHHTSGLAIVKQASQTLTLIREHSSMQQQPHASEAEADVAADAAVVAAAEANAEVEAEADAEAEAAASASDSRDEKAAQARALEVCAKSLEGKMHALQHASLPGPGNSGSDHGVEAGDAKASRRIESPSTVLKVEKIKKQMSRMANFTLMIMLASDETTPDVQQYFEERITRAYFHAWKKAAGQAGGDEDGAAGDVSIDADVVNPFRIDVLLGAQLHSVLKAIVLIGFGLLVVFLFADSFSLACASFAGTSALRGGVVPRWCHAVASRGGVR